jgi:hypothetical protein
MPVIRVEPELYQRVVEAAQERQTSINEILTQAVRLYLWERDRHKISEESLIYRQQHAQLKTQYLNQYIAMYHGQIVDHDPDFVTLRRRIRQQFAHTPVMITRVEELPEQPLARRGFQMETGIHEGSL